MWKLPFYKIYQRNLSKTIPQNTNQGSTEMHNCLCKTTGLHWYFYTIIGWTAGSFAKSTILFIILHTFYFKCAKLWTKWNKHAKSRLVYFSHITTKKDALTELATFTNMEMVAKGLNCQNLPSIMPVKA